MQLILGSGSERRKEILSFFDVNFKQIPSDFDERKIVYKNDPKGYVQKIAEKKGETLAKKYPDDLILTADTAVFLNRKLYNKPKDKEEAFTFLQEMQGNTVQVMTGVCLRKNNEYFSEVEETDLSLNPLTANQIETFHKHFASTESSGGFGIEKGAGLIMKKLEGCYYNVMGLPIQTLKDLLLKMDIDLWDFLRPIA